jgi:hypothetical protein
LFQLFQPVQHGFDLSDGALWLNILNHQEVQAFVPIMCE